MFQLAPFALPTDYGDGIVPLADVKTYLAIEDGETDFDPMIGLLRDAAVDMVERYCGVYLAVRKGVVWTAERLPDSCWHRHRHRQHLRLGVSPVGALTAGGYIDGSGVDQVWNVTTLRLGMAGEVLLKAGQAWPGDVSGGVSLTFTAGYTDDTRPPALVQAVRVFTAHLFANREAVQVSGTIGGEIPLGFKSLCNTVRSLVI